jgi:hypothetical protein
LSEDNWKYLIIKNRSTFLITPAHNNTLATVFWRKRPNAKPQNVSYNWKAQHWFWNYFFFLIEIIKN